MMDVIVGMLVILVIIWLWCGLVMIRMCRLVCLVLVVLCGFGWVFLFVC